MISKGIFFSMLGLIVSFVWLVASDVLDRASPDDCEFCSIANYTTPLRTIYDSDEFMAFKSSLSDCELHYMVIPKAHIKNVHSSEVTCDMLTEMSHICDEILREVYLEKKMIVNNPPFYSMKHLHMHCLGCTRRDLSWTNFKYLKLLFHEFVKPDIQCINS